MTSEEAKKLLEEFCHDPVKSLQTTNTVAFEAHARVENLEGKVGELFKRVQYALNDLARAVQAGQGAAPETAHAETSGTVGANGSQSDVESGMDAAVASGVQAGVASGAPGQPRPRPAPSPQARRPGPAPQAQRPRPVVQQQSAPRQAAGPRMAADGSPLDPQAAAFENEMDAAIAAGKEAGIAHD